LFVVRIRAESSIVIILMEIAISEDADVRRSDEAEMASRIIEIHSVDNKKAGFRRPFR
jgi:hypothetical protein